MKVMSNHKWKDPDVEQVLWERHDDNREIGFKEKVEAFVINKADVIALANEFNLVVFEKESQLC